MSEPEFPLPSWKELEEDGNDLVGLSAEQLETFRQRAVPEPGAALREGPVLTNDAQVNAANFFNMKSSPAKVTRERTTTIRSPPRNACYTARGGVVQSPPISFRG
jgi:hypothetical protein